MAKVKSQFGKKSQDAVDKLVQESRTGRKNSYKFFSIILLDYYNRLGNHNARTAGFFGEKANSISDKSKQSILKYVADNGYDVKASSETTVRKCWGKIKTASAERKLSTVIAGSDHKSLDSNALLKLIESDEIVINIVNNGATIVVRGQDPSVNWNNKDDRGVKGVAYNATRRIDGTVVLKQNRKGKFSRYVLKVTKPEDCKNVKQVSDCRAHWNDVIKKAKEEIATLSKMDKAGKFKACNR